MASDASSKTSAANRPLSPHIQIYRWQWTMTLSILHRATGIALTAGSLLLVWWLVAAAAGSDHFATAQDFIGSWIGRLLLLGWTFSLFYHLCNGIRHLVWDTGRGLELGPAKASGMVAVALSLVLTAVAWLFGYGLF